MTDQTKRCPFCNEEINIYAKKCKHCGEWLEVKPLTTPTSVQDPDTLIRQALAEKYELQEAVGRGGMATVYRAIQKNLDRTVALKVIHQNLVHDTEFVSRFLREARLSASLSHPHIVTIYDVGSVGSVHYLAMEFLQGEDLHSMVGNQGALPPEKVVNWMIALADALDYLHKKRYVHRDIKSSNIIITHEGRPVLMDFGIAHAADGTKLTQAGTVIGTPEYMSPEQAQGKTVDGHSDLYSLGVVMYECLTGKVPFKGDNPLTTIHRVIYDRPEPLVTQNSRLPGWLQEVTLSLLEKEPGNRPDNGRELAAALQSKRRVSVPKKEQLTQKITLPEKSARPGLDTKKKTALWVLPWIIGVVAVMFVAVAVMLFFDGNPSAQRQEAVVINPAPADTLRGPVTQTTQVKPQAATNNRERAEEFEQAGDYLAAQKSYPKAIASYDSALVLMPGNPVLSAKRQQAQAKLKEQFIMTNQRDNTNIVSGVYTDERDGEDYQWVGIGRQIWMAENLAYKSTVGSWAYANDENNVVRYGRLYNWETALKVCPKGWHLPTDSEWTEMIDYLGGEKVAGDVLKNTIGWSNNNNGSNLSGFSALPGGFRSNNGKFEEIGISGTWWSISATSNKDIWCRELGNNYNEVRRNFYYSIYGFSIRCVRN
jgi:uncharacterized protein (TIGR02145 family)